MIACYHDIFKLCSMYAQCNTKDELSITNKKLSEFKRGLVSFETEYDIDHGYITTAVFALPHDTLTLSVTHIKKQGDENAIKFRGMRIISATVLSETPLA